MSWFRTYHVPVDGRYTATSDVPSPLKSPRESAVRTVKVTFCVEAHPALSVAVTVRGKPPASVGVPDSTPLVNMIPSGSVPVTPKVTVPLVPDAVNVTE